MVCQLEIDTDYRLIEDVIEATEEELSRLQRHPELFSSKNIREKFWRNVQLVCNRSVKTVILKQEARDRTHDVFEAAGLESEENVRIPGRDVQRKSWEQFLHGRAPGTEADLSMFAEEGSVQLLPHAGLRILGANLDEHTAIVLDIEAVSVGA